MHNYYAYFAQYAQRVFSPTFAPGIQNQCGLSFGAFVYLHINRGGSPQSSKLFKMMEVKAYEFSPPPYGRLKVVKTEEGIIPQTNLLLTK